MELFNTAVMGKAQNDGAFDIDLEIADRFCHHQIQVELSATPSAGSLDIAMRSPGAADFVSLGTIDMTGTDLIQTFGPCFVGRFRFTPADFDAGKTYNVIVSSGG